MTNPNINIFIQIKYKIYFFNDHIINKLKIIYCKTNMTILYNMSYIFKNI